MTAPLITRRRLLQSAGAGLAMSGLLPAAALSADRGGYKALVCCFFAGGIDAHDTIIPMSAPDYGDWRSVRQSILDGFADAGNAAARDVSSLIALSGASPGRAFGMPQELAPLAALYERGRLAVVPNVGPLIEPTDRQAVRDKTARLPKRLQSHNDQQSTWQSLTVEGARTGWGGQMADIVAGASGYTSISLAGNSTFLVGRNNQPVQLSGRGVVQRFNAQDRLYGSDRLPGLLDEHFRQAGAGSANLFERDIAAVQAAALGVTDDLVSIFENEAIGADVLIEDNKLSGQLARVAQLIAARETLGAPRQIFFVQMGGFDTHNEHAERMPPLHAQLAQAIAAFDGAMESLGLSESVTLFTASDFGRTLSANSSGTDHGWGGHHFVVGGAVRGGRFTGEMPPYAPDHDLDYKRGVLIPTTSVEQYGGALGRWFGLTQSEVAEVFPLIGNFDGPGPALF